MIINSIEAQEFNPNISKDSLFKAVMKTFDPSKVKDLTKMYKEGDDATKEFLLMMVYMPQSSKIESIENLKKNEENIKSLMREYSELVPNGIYVSIEFNPKDIVLSMDESIDLRIHSNEKSNNDGIQIDFQEWNLPFDSKILEEQIEKIGWDNNTILKIKKLLDKANCISISNGEISTIGYARSGMGKYSYKFFKNDLDKNEQKKYNDGCTYIFYERNIVLEYGGGAIGSQCFEKE